MSIFEGFWGIGQPLGPSHTRRWSDLKQEKSKHGVQEFNGSWLRLQAGVG